MCVKNGSNATQRAILRRQRDAGDRQQHLVELRLLEILQQHALGALLRDHRSSFGRLKAAVCTPWLRVAGGEHDVHDADRRVTAELRAAELLVDRQVVLELLQLAAEALELAASPAASVTVMNASNAALKLNHSSSYTSYGPMVGSIDASSSIHATSLS